MVWDCGGGPLFFSGISCCLVFYIFLFPLATAKFIGQIKKNRHVWALSPVGGAHKKKSFKVRKSKLISAKRHHKLSIKRQQLIQHDDTSIGSGGEVFTMFRLQELYIQSKLFAGISPIFFYFAYELCFSKRKRKYAD